MQTVQNIGLGYLRAVYSSNKSDVPFSGSSLSFSYEYDPETNDYVSAVGRKYRSRYAAEISASLARYTGKLKPVAVHRSDDPKTYKLNRRRVREKCVAFSRLKCSRHRLRFYSVSFPRLVSDDVAVELFNIWRTRCVRDYGLRSFIRVSERQKNGTIHFHILTNNRMDIVKVNRAMAVSINNKGYLKYFADGSAMSVDSYNGVDVRYCRSTRGVLYYLSKYISKAEDVLPLTVRASSWSRDVSCLFTSCTLPYADDLDFRGREGFFTCESEWCTTVYACRVEHWGRKVEKSLKELDAVNELVLRYLRFVQSPPETVPEQQVLYDSMGNLVSLSVCPF